MMTSDGRSVAIYTCAPGEYPVTRTRTYTWADGDSIRIMMHQPRAGGKIHRYILYCSHNRRDEVTTLQTIVFFHVGSVGGV